MTPEENREMIDAAIVVTEKMKKLDTYIIDSLNEMMRAMPNTAGKHALRQTLQTYFLSVIARVIGLGADAVLEPLQQHLDRLQDEDPDLRQIIDEGLVEMERRRKNG